MPRLRLRVVVGWTPAAYVSHITDNLRTWAERLAGARRILHQAGQPDG